MRPSTGGSISAKTPRLTVLRGVAAAASVMLFAGIALVPAAPASAADNPNPARITDASWWLMEELLKLDPGTQNGGIYFDKPGYHNTRAANDPNNYSVRDAEDQGGPSDKAAAYDWTFPEAQGLTADDIDLSAYAGRPLASDVQALSPDYSNIARFSSRLLASGKDPNDPRLNGWREFYGQTDSDSTVEGWDFRYDYAVSSGSSHLWHIHLSEDRDKVTSYDNKRALLSVLRGETVEQWGAPHGPMYDRTRSASGSWASSSVLIENNNAITRTAAVALPNGTLHGFNLIPGSGTWTRARSAAGVWAANATHVDTNGSVTDIAAASLPDGTLHLFVLVPGSGTWTRARSAAGVWAANATHVDTNGSVTDIAATGLPDGTMQLSVLVPGSGTWTRARSASGVWAANAVHADTNGSVTDIAAAALPDGTMHLFVLVPGSGTWARARSAAGVWAANATHVDTNGSVIAVSAAGLGDGTLHLTVTVPNAGVWHRYRTLSGSWATNRQIDTNGRIFHTYTAALPDRTMHVGVLVNTA